MITRLKREKDGILMNGKILRSIDPVTGGAQVVIHLPGDDSAFITPVSGELDVRFEDSHLLILNKPPFMPVHPVKQHQNNTLANRVVAYALAKGEHYVFRAHNRLDRNTSGLVLVAKDKYAVFNLNHRVHKTYTALVHGKMEGKGTVRAPIGLRVDSKLVRCVINEGTPAVTHYRVLFGDERYSCLSLVLETGKTHQIRCHMSYLGHPLLGDDLYGGTTELIQRHALHCGEMRFVHPVTGEEMYITAPLPDDMQKLMKKP